MTYDSFDHTLKGNKNQTGPTLGQICHIENSSVDVSTSLEGNKNKTGYKLGDSRLQANSQFRATKRNYGQIGQYA